MNSLLRVLNYMQLLFIPFIELTTKNRFFICGVVCMVRLVDVFFQGMQHHTCQLNGSYWIPIAQSTLVAERLI